MSALNGEGTTAYAYDDCGARVSAQTTYNGLATQSLIYNYNPDGSRQSMTTPAGNFTYAYDAKGRAASLTNPFNEQFTWTYLNNDFAWTQNSANVLTTTYAYNTRGFLTGMGNTTSGNSVLSAFSNMTYDAIGNCTAMTASVPVNTGYSGTTTYAYNSAIQLSQEQSSRSGGYNNLFGYDAVGNLLSFKGMTNNYNSDNQNTANTYDLAGSPTVYKGTACSFDAENRMTATGSILSTGYNPYSQRAWKQTSLGRVYFLYDGTNAVCELNASGGVVAVNTYGANGLAARHTSSGTILYAFDPNGNVSQRLAPNGILLSASMFNAFGTASNTAPGGDPFGYGGQYGYYTDNETGSILLGRRYYDPQSGRFLTRDPIGYEGGINLYSYCGNDPINRSDPSGLAPPQVKYPIEEPGQPGYPDSSGCGAQGDPKHPGYGKKIGKGLKNICDALRRAGKGGIKDKGGKGISDAVAQCLLDFCNQGKYICGGDCGPGHCASSGGSVGHQDPGGSISVCDQPFLPNDPCHNEPLCVSLLHEMIGLCGVSHGPRGPNGENPGGDADPCNPPAKRLCSGLHIQ